MYIVPKNYVEPEAASVQALTAAEREAVKKEMADFVTAKGAPVYIKEVVELASATLLKDNVHLHDSVLVDIAKEIHREWNPEPVEETAE